MGALGNVQGCPLYAGVVEMIRIWQPAALAVVAVVAMACLVRFCTSPPAVSQVEVAPMESRAATVGDLVKAVAGVDDLVKAVAGVHDAEAPDKDDRRLTFVTHQGVPCLKYKGVGEGGLSCYWEGAAGERLRIAAQRKWLEGRR